MAFGFLKKRKDGIVRAGKDLVGKNNNSCEEKTTKYYKSWNES